jgi:hypothetical protein
MAMMQQRIRLTFCLWARGGSGMKPWLATTTALTWAAAFFNFAVQYRPFITLAIIIGVSWWCFAWLCRNYPTTAYLLVCFLRGLHSGSRR